jgi:hypothetical protein
MSDTVIYLVPAATSDVNNGSVDGDGDGGAELVHLHSVPNWAPVADCVLLGNLMGEADDAEIVNRIVDEVVAAFPSERRERLYVGAGHRGEGAIKELRNGLRTDVLVEFELEQYPPTLCRSVLLWPRLLLVGN